LPVGRIAAERCGAKLVYDSHELYSEQEFTRAVRRKWSEIEAKHIGVCDAVITVNPSIASELARRYGVEQVHVIYNAERARARSVNRGRRFHELFNLPKKARVM